MENIIQQENKKLKEAIVKTIAFFDIFEWPLTIYEIWRLIGHKCAYEDLPKALAALPQIETEQGYFFLKGRQNLVQARRDRYSYFLNKLERAKKVAWLFSFVPWVRLIAIGNMIGDGNTKKDGDIDFFIVTKKNRVYLSRLFCTGLAKILGLRPQPATKKDKICLSFYISEQALNLRPLNLQFGDALKNLNQDKYFDIYFLYWFAQLFVLYDADGAYNQLVESNPWVKAYLPNWEPMECRHDASVARRNSKFYFDVWEMLFSGLENTAKKFERRIMPDDLIRLLGGSGGVVIDNQVIKMFKNDRREQVLKLWQEKVKEVLAYGA